MLLLGIAPKAIYFVIMFVLLFMPVDKFKDKSKEGYIILLL